MTSINIASFTTVACLSLLILGISATTSTALNSNQQKATLAGGCFWCMEKPFEKLAGVVSVVSGYTGGDGENPTYEDYGAKGYIEAVEIIFDPELISYEELLAVYWRQIDPTDPSGQFVDRGHSYISAVFYHNDEQKRLAEKSKQELGTKGPFSKPIITPILAAVDFYPAEDYHQDYYKKNPLRYKYYRYGSGRDKFLSSVWDNYQGAKVVPQKNLKKSLSPMQYKVTQEDGTEPAFDNAYWDNKRKGIYVDIVSGEPLFLSVDKYDSGTGWPSFSRPAAGKNIVEKEDRSFFSVRTEVRSNKGDSHLGHVFDDGPVPTGLRYCINSAALRFVPVVEMKKEGYGDFLDRF